jgi:hypothetical protein
LRGDAKIIKPVKNNAWQFLFEQAPEQSVAGAAAAQPQVQGTIALGQPPE